MDDGASEFVDITPEGLEAAERVRVEHEKLRLIAKGFVDAAALALDGFTDNQLLARRLIVAQALDQLSAASSVTDAAMYVSAFWEPVTVAKAAGKAVG